MPIKFNCAKCGKRIGVPDNLAGKTGKCPACGTTLTVPTTPAPPPARPDRQGKTDYNFRLSEEDRNRIEEEERFRAEAKIRAEREARSKETPIYPAPSATSNVITFDCPFCLIEITVASAAGTTTSCPKCREVLKVPGKTKSTGGQGRGSTAFKPRCCVCGGEALPGETTCFSCASAEDAPRANAPPRSAEEPGGSSKAVSSLSNVVGLLLALSCSLAFLGGVFWAASAYLMDTTVEVPDTEFMGQVVHGHGRVYNVGLMQERQNGMMAGGGLALLGLVGLVARQSASKKRTSTP